MFAVSTCIKFYMMKDIVRPYEKDFLDLINENYLFRPGQIKRPLVEYFPPWRELMDWAKIQDNLLDFFKTMVNDIKLKITK